MQKSDIQTRIEELRKTLANHNYNYYVLSEPVISDYNYDMLMKELQALEEKYPEFDDPNSPTKRVGDDRNQNFEQVKHQYQMLSLGNTYNFEELQSFDERIRKDLGDKPLRYVCELKYDGSAISLQYTEGKLVRAVTRGDGTQGDDVTNNVKTIKSVPLYLRGENYPKNFEIRGEVMLTHKVFQELNKIREENGESLFANPRNAAAGSLKLQNSSVVAQRKLDAFLYYMIGDELPSDSHFENLRIAAEWGFKISRNTKICENISEVFEFVNYWDTERNNLDFDIDGIVIKVDSVRLQEQLGNTSKNPRWAISYKFKAESALTELLSIDFQVGRTGAITPVANLAPVQLAGTVVKRASLHNADIIEKLDVRVGDFVYVEKGGEIIPKITSVELSKRAGNEQITKYISHCPECGTELIRIEGEVAHYCPASETCPPQIKGRIEHFIGRDAMDITAGEATVKALYEKDYVKFPSDLYFLNFNQLMSLEGFKEKSSQNLIESITKSKEQGFERVLYALGIRFVGKTVAKILVKELKSIDAIINATVVQLSEINEIGSKIAETVVNYFKNEENIRQINLLKEAGLNFVYEEEELKSESLKDIKIVVSGTFEHFSREGIKKAILENGGKVLSTISKNTDLFVTGENVGPKKLEKSAKLGIKIISENEFLEMIT